MGNITGLYSCPDCGRPLSFSAPWLNHAICACGSVIGRDHQEKLHNQPLLVIQNVGDIIQPGVTGSWNGSRFIITGRFRVWFEDSVFNYWSLDLGDGVVRYLGEGYGLYGIYVPADKEIVSYGSGQRLPYRWPLVLKDGRQFTQMKTGQGRSVDVEGAFYKPEGTKINSYEAVAEDGQRIEILEYDKEIVEIFQVHPVSFDSLSLANLRGGEAAGKTFRCNKCSHENTITGYPYIQSWTCQNCSARFSMLRTGAIEGEGENKGDDPGYTFLPGETLELQGITYSVTGCAQKVDKTLGADTWKEYSLYNREYGFAFLTEADGHWMLVRQTLETPPVSYVHTELFHFRDKPFYLFNKYRFRIKHALGCFPGNIFDNAEEVEATDFIGPPDLWSVEQDKNGFTWFSGIYISRREIKQQTDRRLPAKRGVGPAEPKGAVSINTVVLTTALVILAAMLIHFAVSMSNRSKVLVDKDYFLNDLMTARSFTTDRFELKKWRSNLQFDITAYVDNTWFELSATLVNAQTGDEYSLEQGVEYYHGYSDGESWSEGGQSETAYLTSIPAGTYYLQINGLKDAAMASSSIQSFHLRITNDTPMQRNFWITLLLLLIWPVYKILITRHYEDRRWSNSAFTKYNYS